MYFQNAKQSIKQLFSKQILVNIFTGMFLLILLVPSLMVAYPFQTDTEIKVYPEHEVLTFRDTIINQTQIEYFVIENTSDTDRVIKVTHAPTPGFSPFSYANSTDLLVAAHTTRSFPVMFTPTNLGFENDTLTIQNSATGEEKVLKLQGKAINSYDNKGITISQEEINFPKTMLGESSVATFKVTNLNNSSVDVDFFTSNPFFLNDGSSVSIPANQTKSIQIRFTPSVVKLHSETLTLRTPNQTFNIKLKGDSFKLTPPVYDNISDKFDVYLTKSSINPDLNETTYFNAYLPEKSSINLEISRQGSNSIIYSERFPTLAAGNYNWYIAWNGKNNSGDKVSNGKYTYTITNKTSSHSTSRTGTITVTRSQNHQSENILNYLDQNSPYQRYNTLNEDLITNLSLTPATVTSTTQEVYANFTLRHNAPVTANILDSNKQVVKTIKKNMPTSAGYKHNYIEWNATLNEKPAPNGIYYLEIFTSRAGEYDSDIVPLVINLPAETTPQYQPTPPIVQPPVEERPTTEKPTVEQPTQQQKPVEPKPTTPQPDLDICLNFIDVENHTQLCDAVALSASNNLLVGSAKLDSPFLRIFRPDDQITRAEATAIIVRLLGIPLSSYNPTLDGNLGFKDLDTSEWYMPYFKTISQLSIRQNETAPTWLNPILKSHTDGNLRPHAKLTKMTFYRMLIDALQQSKHIQTNFKLNTTPNQQARHLDIFLPSQIPYTNFIYQVTPQINFNPDSAITRKEVVEFIYKLQLAKKIQF